MSIIVHTNKFLKTLLYLKYYSHSYLFLSVYCISLCQFFVYYILRCSNIIADFSLFTCFWSFVNICCVHHDLWDLHAVEETAVAFLQKCGVLPATWKFKNQHMMKLYTASYQQRENLKTNTWWNYTPSHVCFGSAICGPAGIGLVYMWVIGY